MNKEERRKSCLRTEKIARLRNNITVRRNLMLSGRWANRSHKRVMDRHFKSVFELDPKYTYTQSIKLSMAEVKEVYKLLPDGALKRRLGTHCYPVILPT
jgi:hypothetical protein